VTDDVLAEKLESLRRCLRRIETKTPATAALLEADLDAQDILSLNLQRAAQLVVGLSLHVLSTRDLPLPNNMADCIRALVPLGLSEATATHMTKAVGFRNLAVHAYRAIDWHIVHAIAVGHVGDFRDFMRELSRL
jgi:uncharacterized protein YutE (UPF0331/DUF86 family)